jgi:flavodoxin I
VGGNSIAMNKISALLAASALGTSASFAPITSFRTSDPRSVSLDMAAVGIFFGTSTGSTEACARQIYKAFGSELAAEPVDVETVDNLVKAFGSHDSLVVGTPTWNTGADTERSGTGWDVLYYNQLAFMKSTLEGKKIAVFGLGDQITYSENYADATGELFDVFDSLGCQMLGLWSREGYAIKASKSIRDGKFCGLLLDEVNQEELTAERIERWVAQLKDEGILGSKKASSLPTISPEITPHPPSTMPPIFKDDADALKGSSMNEEQTETERLIEYRELERNSFEEKGRVRSSDDFTPHFNPFTGRTMWTSADGRTSYVTVKDPTSTQSKLSS